MRTKTNRMDKAMKVVVDALVYETAMCVDKEIARKIRGCQLGQPERLEIILTKMHSSGFVVSQTNKDAVIWLPQNSAFGGDAIKHKLEPDTWEATNVDMKQWEAESYASVLQCFYKASAARSIANNRAFFELLNWGYLKMESERDEGCRVFGLTEAGRRVDWGHD